MPFLRSARMMPCHTRFILLLFCLIIPSAIPAAAQVDTGQVCTPVTTLAYGDRDRGQIDSKNVFVVYCFEGSAGDGILIEMNTLDGTLDPLLAVIDPQQTDQQAAILAEDDDSGDGVNARLETTLPYTGTFLIIVTRYNMQTGTSEGSFELILDQVSFAATTEADFTIPPISGGVKGTPEAEATVEATEAVVISTPTPYVPPSITPDFSAENLIIGDWEYTPSNVLMLQYRFVGDGTFTQALQTAMGPIYCSGTYTISSDSGSGTQLSVNFGYTLSTAPGACPIGPDWAILQFSGSDQFTLASSDGITGQSLGLGAYRRMR